MRSALGSQRLVALFVAGWMLFNFPLLGLWDHDITVLGLPLFPLALFVLWGGMIAALAWIMESGDGPGDPAPSRPEPHGDRGR